MTLPRLACRRDNCMPRAFAFRSKDSPRGLKQWRGRYYYSPRSAEARPLHGGVIVYGAGANGTRQAFGSYDRVAGSLFV